MNYRPQLQADGDRHHRRGGRGRAGRERLAVGLTVSMVGALCLWATIPFGSASMWARSVVSLACLAVAVLLYVTARERPPIAMRRALWIIPACALALWSLLQTVPMPMRVLRWVQPLTGDLYQALSGAAAAAPISLDPFKTRHTMILWTAYALLGWASAGFLRSRNVVRSLSLVFVGLGLFQAVCGLAWARVPFLEESPFQGERLIGTFSSGNSFGGFLALTLPVSLGVIFSIVPRFAQEARGRLLQVVLASKQQVSRFVVIVLTVLCFAVQAVAILLSGSRGAIISAALCMLILLVWFVRSTWNVAGGHTIRAFLVGVAVVSVIGIGGTYAMTISRFQDLADGGGSSAVSRLAIWKGALSLLKARPLGTGPGCFGDAFTGFQPVGFGARRVYHAHNDFIEILCELGIVGFIPVVLLLIHGFRRTGGLWADAKGSCSVWLYRGAMFAVFAGLSHACVDFNLSSRPGVAVSFVVLFGIMLGYAPRPAGPRPGRDRADRIMAVPGKLSNRLGRSFRAVLDGASAVAPAAGGRVGSLERRSTPTKTQANRVGPPLLGTCLMAVAVILLGVCCWRTAAALRLMEVGRVSLGGAPDDYCRFAPAPVGRGRGVGVLEKARDLLPRYGRAHYILGTGRIMEFKRTLEECVRAGMESSPESSEEMVALVVERAMARERAETYAAAMKDMEVASRLSPWNADIRAGLSRAAAESIAATTNGAAADMLAGRALSEARGAVLLAPNECAVLRRACAALTVTYRAAGAGGAWAAPIRALLLEWGRHAIRLGGGHDDRIISCWYEVGVPVLDAIGDADMPPRSLWYAYRQFDRYWQGADCLAALDALDRVCAGPADGASGFDRERGLLELERFRAGSLRERCRWWLRLGRWPEYEQYAERRHALYQRELDRELAEFGSDAAVPYYIKLKGMDGDDGLDLARRLDLCAMLLARGERIAAEGILAEVSCLDSDEAGRLLGGFESSHQALLESGYGKTLLQARLLMFRSDFYSAGTLLRELVETQDLPFRLRHRVQLLSADCLFRTEHAEEGGQLLLGAARQCPGDADVLRALIGHGLGDCGFEGADGRRHDAAESLSAVTPRLAIGTRFMGGRIVLDGIEIRPACDDGARPGDVELRVYWRFWGAVPGDLRMATFTRTPGGGAAFSNRYSFSKNDKLLFGDGTPMFGCTIVASVRLGGGARLGSSLGLILQSGAESRALPSEEGLRLIEILDWQKYSERSGQ